MNIVIDKTFKQKRNFVFSLLTDEQRQFYNAMQKNNFALCCKYILALYEFSTTKKTKAEIVKKYDIGKSYFYENSIPVEKRNKLLSRKKTNLIEFIKTHILAIYGSECDKKTTVEICFNMKYEAYRKMLQRTDFINQASCLLFVAGVTIPEIENILKSKSKHFNKLNAFLVGAVAFPDFIEYCRILWSNNSSLEYHETSIEQIIKEIRNIIY